jgi:hypothetical protein
MSKPDIYVYQSEQDGHWVVEINTQGISDKPNSVDGPMMRIWLNEYLLHNGTDYVEVTA